MADDSGVSTDEQGPDTVAMRARHHPRSDGLGGSCCRCHPWDEADGGCDVQILADALDLARERAEKAEAELDDANLDRLNAEAERDYARNELVEMHGRPPGRWDELLRERRELRDELAAVTGFRAECERQFQAKVDELNHELSAVQARVVVERKQAAQQALTAAADELDPRGKAAVDILAVSGSGEGDSWIAEWLRERAAVEETT